MRAMNGVSVKRPSNVTTAPSISTRPTGRRRWSWSAMEISCRSSGISSPCSFSSSWTSTVSNRPVSTLMTSAFFGE